MVMNAAKSSNQVNSVSAQTVTGLQEKEFRQVCRSGLGDPNNSYPHSMAWFRDHLYVGTTRSVLALLHNRHKELQSWEVFPVKCPEDIWELDLRSQIWRYNPAGQEWEKVLAAPLVTGSDGTQVSLFQGVRNMAVFQAKCDTAPALYCLTWSPEKGPGPLLLRSEDGLDFQQLPLRTTGITGTFSTYRPLVGFKGKLFTAPTGRTGSGNKAGVAVVLATDDPLNGTWQQVNQTGFGDPANLTVFELAVFNGFLYAGTLNSHGFQIWKTAGEGDPPYRWTKVLTDGAGRGSLNEAAGSMCEFKGALYVGSVIQNGGYDRSLGIGPAASELIRLYPDDSWELLVGDGRVTGKGLKIPLSGFGPGFENFFSGYFWRMCVHQGWLYLGTFDSTVLMPYSPKEKWPEKKRREMDGERMDELIRKEGGFDLWRTRDGIRWVLVTKRGFGNPYNYGVRTMVSTPYGLFLGAANPFGPEVAVRRSTGWTYEPNPKGGLEIWVGSRTASEKRPDSAAPGVPAGKVMPSGVNEDNKTVDFCEKVIDEYYRGSGFRNFGFWRPDIRFADAACRNLMEELLAYLPEKKGRILDLAAGCGATTGCLLNYYPASAITGLCLEREEQKEALERFPDIKFMTKVIPGLPENEFDAVVCCERLSSLRSGAEWLKAAVSSLKPGGYLATTQILSLGPNSPWKRKEGRRQIPMTTAADFNDFLAGIGLCDIKVADCTIACWQSFHKDVGTYLAAKLFSNEIDEEMLDRITKKLYGNYGQICAYVLAVGRRP